MTTVRISRQDDRYAVTAQGHADGYPDVCTAISTLVCTLRGWLHNTDAAILREDVEAGDAGIRWRGGTGAETVCDLMTVGFLQLERSYPDALRVKIYIA